MSLRHVVQQGECIASIAHHYGFFWETLWSHEDNQSLRRSRGEPNCLAPGDVVSIPEKRVKSHEAETNRSHVYRLKTTPVRFRIRMVDDGEPLAQKPYTLRVDQRTFQGTTDDDGWVDHLVPAQAEQGTLTLGETTLTLAFRHLAPLETPEGIRDRLSNLGYLPRGGVAPTPFVLRNALCRFQHDHSLDPTGALDAPTREKLQAQHTGDL